MNHSIIAPTAVRTLKSWCSRCVQRLLWRAALSFRARAATDPPMLSRIIKAGKPVVVTNSEGAVVREAFITCSRDRY